MTDGVGTTVGAGVATGVGGGVGAGVGSAVAVGWAVGDGVGEAVSTVGAGVGVPVGVGEAVTAAVAVGVGDGVAVDVGDRVTVGVGNPSADSVGRSAEPPQAAARRATISTATATRPVLTGSTSDPGRGLSQEHFRTHRAATDRTLHDVARSTMTASTGRRGDRVGFLEGRPNLTTTWG